MSKTFKKILQISHKSKKVKILLLFGAITFCLLYLLPYILTFLGTKIISLGYHSTNSQGGFIALPVHYIKLGDFFLRTSHRLSSRGTVFMLANGSDFDKELVLDCFSDFARKNDLYLLKEVYRKETNPEIKDKILVTMGSCQDEDIIPFLKEIYTKDPNIALIALSKLNTPKAKKYLLSLYLNTKSIETKKIILSFGSISDNVAELILLHEKNSKLREKTYTSLLDSKFDKFYEKHKESLFPLYEECLNWLSKDTFLPSDLINSYKKHPEFSIAEQRFLLLGHAVLRNPDSIPFLKSVIKDSKSEELKELAKKILKVIPPTSIKQKEQT